MTGTKPSSKVIRAIVFDFDGVLAESVDIKTRAYTLLFHKEGKEAVSEFIEYHLKNGGVSRFEKIKFFYRDILHRPLSEKLFQKLCAEYSGLVVNEVSLSPWVDGARDFLVRNKKKYIFIIVSGTPENEMKDIVLRRSMSRFFNSVRGSPKSKLIVLREVMSEYNLEPDEIVFVGDAETDWLAAKDSGIPFLWRCASNKMEPPCGYVGPRLSSLSELETILKNFAPLCL